MGKGELESLDVTLISLNRRKMRVRVMTSACKKDEAGDKRARLEICTGT